MTTENHSKIQEADKAKITYLGGLIARRQKGQNAFGQTPTLKAVGSIPVGQTMKNHVKTPLAGICRRRFTFAIAEIDNKLTTAI